MSDPPPGISNRGWNDPPKLEFNTGAQASPKKQLTQRVTHILPTENKPNTSGGVPKSSSEETLLLSASRLNPPENLPPPLTDGIIIDLHSRTSGGGSTLSADNSTDVEHTSSNEEDSLHPTCEDVLSRLRGTTEECKDKLRPRVLDDIRRKLEFLEQAWNGEKLPAAVLLDMDKLSRALMERRYEEANEVHLNLMLNHISVVSGWMVGIKRLISEARTILPPEMDSSVTDQEASSQETTVPLLLPVNTSAS